MSQAFGLYRPLLASDTAYLGWGAKTGLEPPVEPRSFGPKCKCHNERNMKRIGPLEYGCLKSGQIFQLKELLWPS